MYSSGGRRKQIDINDIDIVVACNVDLRLATLIVNQLRVQGAKNIRLCYHEEQTQYSNADIDAHKIPGSWESQSHFEWAITGSSVVISLFYNDFDKQEMLYEACLRKEIDLFVTWDSGMELDIYVNDKECPRTRLHDKLLTHRGEMNWILFQVGIFDEEILRNDVSTITTAFNSPNQYIFLNVTVKDDLAELIAKSIRSTSVQPNRNYVVGDFIAHTFLGHAYRVANIGERFDKSMPATIAEFEASNQLRLTGIVSARPLPRILYPGCSIYFQRLGIEISFQHDAGIYKIFSEDHKRMSFKEWVEKPTI